MKHHVGFRTCLDCHVTCFQANDANFVVEERVGLSSHILNSTGSFLQHFQSRIYIRDISHTASYIPYTGTARYVYVKLELVRNLK